MAQPANHGEELTAEVEMRWCVCVREGEEGEIEK